MADKAFLVDTLKCTGCRACQTVCKQWNNLPAEDKNSSNASKGENSSFDGNLTFPAKLSAITFNHIIFSKIDRTNANKPVWQMMYKMCYHCEKPNCMKVCPAEAIYKNDYWVVIDQEKCIGCGECEKSCVYNVPHVSRADFNEYGTGKFILKNKAYKCHACSTDQRKIPACAAVCPCGAITFDFRVKLAAEAKKRLKAARREFPRAGIYGLEEFGGMHVITILKDSPENSGLPVNPQPLDSGRIESANEIYRSLSVLTLGLPFFKRALYKTVKSFMS
jgi:formate dehydrogenase iron-sulfur subunit